MKSNRVVKVNSISEFHKVRGLRPPLHPLVSLVDYSTLVHLPEHDKISWLQTYYSISLKKGIQGKYRYGQSEYDFDEGLMSFFAPNQILTIEYVENISPIPPSGWILLIHPDFIWNTPLAKTIKQYSFFDYDLTEALFLSEKEEKTIADIMRNIQQEYQANIDKFSQNIIISQIELLLNYAERFYERQYITRKKENHALLSRLEEVLDEYFQSENREGLPSVHYIADTLHVSPN